MKTRHCDRYHPHPIVQRRRRHNGAQFSPAIANKANIVIGSMTILFIKLKNLLLRLASERQVFGERQRVAGM
jgi:hypothetical protein